MNSFDKYHDLAAFLLGRDHFPLPLPKLDRDYPHNLGLLSDSEESELTAKVLNHTEGMTLDVWRDLRLEQRVPWLQVAVENLKQSRNREEVDASIIASLNTRAAKGCLLVSGDEVSDWPVGLVDRLVHEGILAPIHNSKAIRCEACGQDHVETVQYVQLPSRLGLRAYIDCPENGRVHVPLPRLRQWTIEPSKLQQHSKSDESIAVAVVVVANDEPLSERAQVVLIAMVELGLLDSDHRRTTEGIVAKAMGGSADGNSLKGVMADLVTRGLVQSKTGRGGGYWLTEKGKIRAEKLRET